MVHKGIRPVVNSNTHNTHIICIQYSMTKAITLPHCYHFYCPITELFIKLEVHLGLIFSILFVDVLIKILDNIIYHSWHHFHLHSSRWPLWTWMGIFIFKNLKTSKSEECRSHPENDGTFLKDHISWVNRVSLDSGVWNYNRTCSSSWDPYIRQNI